MVSIDNIINVESGAIESTAIECEQMKEAFCSYLHTEYGSKCNPTAYVACLENSSEFAVRQRISPLKFWLISDTALFNSVSEKLINNFFFRMRDRKNYQLYPKVAGAYFNFIKNGVYTAFLNEERTNNDTSEPTVSTDGISEKIGVAPDKRKQQTNARTIVEAAIEVLKASNAALSVQQIYNEIISKQLYDFKAVNPLNVLNVEIRSHCVAVSMPSRANHKKLFKISHTSNGVALYTLLDTTLDEVANARPFVWNCEAAAAFQRWMLSQGKAENTARSYCSSLSRVVALFANEYSQAQREASASGGARKFSELLKTNPQYREINVTAHNQCSAAVAALCGFLEVYNPSARASNEAYRSSNYAAKESVSNVVVYDWERSPNITGTKPISICFSAHSQAIQTDSWKALLICAYEYAVGTFPKVNITNVSLGNGRRKLCSYNGHEISYAERLKCGLYVDTAFSANDVVGIVGAILHLCEADVGDVKILYRNNSFGTPQITTDVNTMVWDLSEEEINIISVFKEVFPYSMNLGFVDLSKLKSEYNSRFNTTISLTDDAIYHLIRNNAIKTDPKAEHYTHLDNLARPEILSRIKQFVNSEIEKGIKRVYAKPIYDTFKDHLGIAVNEDLLLTIIETSFNNEFKVNRKSMFVSSKGDAPTLKIGEEIATAIARLLQENVMPFSVDDISNGLPGYPRNKVEDVLLNNINKISSVVAVGNSQYAYIDYVYIYEEQVQQINDIIAQGIEVREYKDIEELFTEIAETIPDVIDLNPEISKADIIKAIKYKIGGTYTALHGRFVPRKGSR